jgi:hypothetical protein
MWVEVVKMNIITTGFESGSFDWSDKYNIWSGLIGGFLHFRISAPTSRRLGAT